MTTLTQIHHTHLLADARQGTLDARRFAVRRLLRMVGKRRAASHRDISNAEAEAMQHLADGCSAAAAISFATRNCLPPRAPAAAH